MPKTLEQLLKEEILKRQNDIKAEKAYRRRKVAGILLAIGLLSGGTYSLYRAGGATRLITQNETQARDLEPVPLPESGVLKQYYPVDPGTAGYIRFFLRAPVESDETELSESCGIDPESDASTPDSSPGSSSEDSPPDRDQYHYFVEILDWESDEVVTTAFVRSSDMLAVLVPYGTYKIRYTAGIEWYGETELFGGRTLYEMTESLSTRAAKFEVDAEQGGSDLGFRCNGQGNLGRQPVDKDDHKEGIPLEETDMPQAI